MSLDSATRLAKLNAAGREAAEKAWAAYVIALGPTGPGDGGGFSSEPSTARRLLANRQAQATWTATLAEAGVDELALHLTRHLEDEAFMAVLAAGAAGLLGAFVFAPRDLVGAAQSLGVDALDVSFAIYEDQERSVRVEVAGRVALLPDAFAQGSIWRQEFSGALGPVGSLGGGIAVTLDDFSFGAGFDHDAGVGSWRAGLTFKWRL